MQLQNVVGDPSQMEEVEWHNEVVEAELPEPPS